MKNIFLKVIIFSFTVIMLSCEALPVNYTKSRAWLIDKNNRNDSQMSLSILSVRVDRTGGWDSIERETAALAPLYFWNHGCAVVPAEQKPAYAAEIQMREREINSGWQTKRSLAVEVRIWEYGDVLEYGTKKLPLVTGIVTALGDESFSSFETTEKLLSKAIKAAAEKLVLYERQKDDA